MPDLRDWVPDEAVESLTVRRALQNVEDPIKLAAEIIKESLPLATMSMAHLAIHSNTEMIRFNASKYIMDTALGNNNKGFKIEEAKPAWDSIYNSVLVEVDNITRQGE